MRAGITFLLALGNGMQQGVTRASPRDEVCGSSVFYSPTKNNYTMGVNLMEVNGGQDADS